MRPHGPFALRMAHLVCIVVLLAAGCAAIPTGRFEALSEASRSLRVDSVVTYTRIEALQARYMTFNPADGPLTVESFKPVVVDDQGQRRDFDLGPRLRFRESALDVLADYTEVLVGFAKKDYEGDLDKATTKLNGSVAALAQQFQGNAEAQKAAGILATVVNGLGRAAIERVRRQTLRDAMDKAQPGVDGLTQQLIADNVLIAQAVTVMRNGVLRVANGIRPPNPSPQRLALDEDVSRIIVEGREIHGSLDALNAALKTIPAAHAEIRDTLDHRDVSLTQLQALVGEAKRLNKYNRSLR